MNCKVINLKTIYWISNSPSV